jgi:uncharacterized repeat protein (TIGR01451 family)/CSLREA domain-containing protein
MALALAGAVMLPAQAVQAANITVNGNGDTVAVDGVCTLREAILNANGNNQAGSADCVAGAGADSISFNLGASAVITLSGSQLPAVTGPLTIAGGSPLSLTLNANSASGVFLINPGAQVTLTGMTVENGNATNGAIQNGGALILSNATVFNNVSLAGGGIYNTGTLRVVNIRVISNTGTNGGGGIFNFSGLVELQNSSVTGNAASSASLNGGGGLFSVGSSVSPASVIIVNSTIASNTTALRGGGLFNDVASSLFIRNSTVSGNSATEGGGIYNGGTIAGMDVGYATIASNNASAGAGGVQSQAGSTSSLIGTIIAGNTGTTANDCSGADFNSLGYNLIGSTAGCTITGSISTNVTDVPALLGPLADNGGPTLTHLPLAGSPALDVIPFGLPVCNLAVTDQRGVVRPQGPACDMGAVEAAFPGAALVAAKTVSPAIAIPNQVFTFTIVVRNTGSATASNVLISDTLPMSTSVAGPISFQPLSAAAPQALVFGADIAAGAAVTIQIPAKLDAGVPAGTVLTNTVFVTSPSVTGTVSASVSLPVAQSIYLPMIFRDTLTPTVGTAQ